MKFNKGFSMIGLMAVVAIVAIIAVMSLPVYNQYIERTKVSKEIPVIGTYKNDIASCFMKNDSLENCNDGESGIHPGLDNNGKILSLNVFKGNIVMIIDAQNHVEDVEPVELMYVVNPQLDATFPTLDWNLYCNDYSSDNNALVKECKGLITDKDGDGYDDSVEEEWGSDPLDPDSVPVNWQAIESLFTDWSNNGGRVYTSDWNPEVTSQTSDFTQTRSYTQEQTRERTDREQDSFSGDIRVVDVVIETQTLSGEESRNVVVNNTSGGWVDTGSTYACSDWTPSASDYYETQMIDQTRVCSQDQETTYTYSVGGSFTDTQTVNVTEERTVEGTQTLWVDISNDVSDWTNVGSRSYTSSWEPNITGQTSDFTQTRSYTQEQERTISEREENQLTGDVRVVSTSTETRTISDSTSRTVTVSEGAWVNDGSVYSCGAWSPALGNQTSDFTQTRSCSQDQTKTYTYSVGGSFVDTQTVTVTQSQVVEVTSTAGGSGDGWSSWSTYNTSCGAWGPDPSTVNQGQSFTQTRSCTDYQERFKYFVVNGQVVDSERGTRTTSRTESRNATGTKPAVANWSHSKIYSRSGSTPWTIYAAQGVRSNAINAVNNAGLNPSSVYSQRAGRTINLTINYQTLWLNHFVNYCSFDYVSSGRVRVTCSDTFR